MRRNKGPKKLLEGGANISFAPSHIFLQFLCDAVIKSRIQMFQDERSNDNIYTVSIDKLHCEGVGAPQYISSQLRV